MQPCAACVCALWRLGADLCMLLNDTLAQHDLPPQETLKQLTFAIFLPLLIVFDAPHFTVAGGTCESGSD